MSTKPEEGAEYPRKVAVVPGMPEGWHGIERQYGPGSKSAGQVYCRFNSDDGKHKHVSSAKAAIEVDCKSKGLDPAPFIEDYLRLQKQKKQDRSEDAKVEREKTGKLKGEQREHAIERFRQAHGELKGPIVFNFPDWVTRWHYQPNCDQVMVEYIDPEGNSWKLLKDLECAFQYKIENGDTTNIGEMIEIAKTFVDPEKFAGGSRGARASGGTYELRGASDEGGRSMSPEERDAMRKQREEEKKAAQPFAKRPRHAYITFPTEPVAQGGWAAMESKADVQQAFQKFRAMLKDRGFKENVQLMAVFGVASDRKFARRICGIYFQMPEAYSARGCYQKLVHCPNAKDEIGCDCIYISFSSAKSRWELTTELSEVRPVVAHSADGPELFANAKGPWQVQDGNGDFSEDKGVVILTETSDFGEVPAASESKVE